MSGPRRLLVLLLILGSLGNLGGGTTASFTASTTNPAANFATGTLVLGNEVDGAGMCFSTGTTQVDVIDDDDDDNTFTCDSLTPVNLMKPGDEVSIDLDLTNDGSLPGDLTLLSSVACSSADDPDADYHGSGDLCDAVQVNVQEWADPSRDVGVDELTCFYGGGDASVCDFDTWDDPTPKTLDDFTTTYETPTGLPLGGIDDQATRWFTISFAIDIDVDNTYQGLEATWGLIWSLEQA